MERIRVNSLTLTSNNAIVKHKELTLYYDIDPNGTLGLTIKRVANQAVRYATDGAIDGLYKAESSGGTREDSSGASWYKDVPKPFTKKDGSQHVPNRGNPNRGLGYYGLEAGQPDKDGNYNTEDAIWKLMNAVQSTGGIKERENVSPSGVNSDMIYGGLIVMGKGIIFIFGTFGTPAIIITGPIGLSLILYGGYVTLAGAGIVPLNPWDIQWEFFQKRGARE